ncbi:MAG: hypothetical protein COA95_11435 [Methylophaga sp.]|nr:MAG: hypothetical protein COA95_11435 [Methylophaga sp.]
MTNKFKFVLQKGFTLLELVLVLFLITLMASATLMLTENIEDQAKYDETKRRMEIMRKAIVGDPTRTVNDGPEISGFVADMGRLPICVAELLTLGDASGSDFQSPCDGSLIKKWDEDPSSGIWFGWHGPYIQVLPEKNGNLRFRDGYGNTGTNASDAGGTNLDASDTADEEHNSGWTWKLDASNAIIHMQSYGFDGSLKYPKGATIDDVTPLVYGRNHLTNSGSLVGRVRFLNLSTATSPNILYLNLNYPNDVITSNSFTIDASSAGTGFSPQITFPSGTFIPMGVRTIQVLCDSTDYVYDGTCTNSTYNYFVNITISPTSQAIQFNLLWDIP